MNKNIIGINGCVKDCHEAAVKGGWWHDAEGKKKDRNVGELLCLIHSEISEAMEGARKGLMERINGQPFKTQINDGSRTG